MPSKKNRTISFFYLFVFFMVIQAFLLPVSYSQVSYTVAVLMNFQVPQDQYVWIFGSDDFVHKLNKSDLDGPEIFAWDSDTSFLHGGCEFRLEDGNEYIYLIDSGNGPNSDKLLKFHASNGTELSRWDISDYSKDAEGLVWNGSRWFISDSRDDLIYQVDPQYPTIAERSFSYSDQKFCGGLAWDGSYLWAFDYGTDAVYQMDVYGNIQTSWDFAPSNPVGATYDPASEHLWIVDRSGYLYEYHSNGTQLGSWGIAGNLPKGVAFSSSFP